MNLEIHVYMYRNVWIGHVGLKIKTKYRMNLDCCVLSYTGKGQGCMLRGGPAQALVS